MKSPEVILALVILLALGVIVLPIFRWFRLGTVLAFLTAGAILGPWGLKLAHNFEDIHHFTEFGIVFLLFLIGLELSPAKLWRLRRAVLGLGTLQILVTGLCIAGYGLLFGGGLKASLVIGFSLAMSSTAIVLQLLAEKRELNTPHGESAFAILLAQDLAVVPLLALVPLLGEAEKAESRLVILHGLESLGALLGIVIIVRWILRPVLRLLAKTENKEAFRGAVLLAVLGSALLMEEAHLSKALGAFLTGLLLADSEERHEIEAVAAPFRSYLLGLFFVAIGMSVDFGILGQSGFLVLGHSLGLMAIKILVLFLLCKIFRLSFLDSARVALLLSQCGEFAFVVFDNALSVGVIKDRLFQSLLLLVPITMAVTPSLEPIASWLARKKGASGENDGAALE